MALTVVQHHFAEWDQMDISSVQIRPFVLQCDTSYPSGGYPITPSLFLPGARKIIALIFSPTSLSRCTFQVGADPLSGRVRLFTVSGTIGWSEAGTGANVSSVTVRGLAVGY